MTEQFAQAADQPRRTIAELAKAVCEIEDRLDLLEARRDELRDELRGALFEVPRWAAELRQRKTVRVRTGAHLIVADGGPVWSDSSALASLQVIPIDGEEVPDECS